MKGLQNWNALKKIKECRCNYFCFIKVSVLGLEKNRFCFYEFQSCWAKAPVGVVFDQQEGVFQLQC